MRWRRRDAGATARLAASAPSDLRVHLPLLWPQGPDGPVDDAALRALAGEYARTGRGVEDLLADLDRLCSVLGLGASSRMVETSSVAWADAFLDTVGGVRPEARESLAEVERRLVRSPAGWSGPVPGSRLLVVSWPSAETGPDPAELARVVAVIRQVFPGAAVAEQPEAVRVLAAVDGDDAVARRTEMLRARCGELGRSAPPTVEVLTGPVDPGAARALFRDVG